MARPGVNYETVKQTAIKLLSQGTVPSVQKIRENLGTGSNTTIAVHLKVWRKEHKSKEIHHLPANMPKELVSAIEVLWQTAMEHAQSELVVVKQDLDQRREQMQQEKLISETNINELKNRLADNQQLINSKNKEIQNLHTELAITQEKLSATTNELATTRTKYDFRLNQLSDEKYTIQEKADDFNQKIIELQQQLVVQAEEHQSILKEDRSRQEQSENRWLILIDHARQEAKDIRKKYESAINKKSLQIKELQGSISDIQCKTGEQAVEIKHNKKVINDLQTKLNKNYESMSSICTVIDNYKSIITMLV